MRWLLRIPLLVLLCFTLAGNVIALEYRFYHPDHLGSNVIVTDRSGAVVQRTVTAPYGELRSVVNASGQSIAPGADNVRHLYTGQEHEPESGLVAFGSRHYDPFVGRFLSVDPELINLGESFKQLETLPGVLSGHSYAANRPTTLIDPTGRFSTVAAANSNGNGQGMNVRLINLVDEPSPEDFGSSPRRDEQGSIQQIADESNDQSPRPGTPKISPTAQKKQLIQPDKTPDSTTVVHVDIEVDDDTTKEQISTLIAALFIEVLGSAKKDGDTQAALVVTAKGGKSDRRKVTRALKPDAKKIKGDLFLDPIVLVAPVP